MNSIIEAQETFLEFCPWNWKSDFGIRMVHHWRTLSYHGFYSRVRDFEREAREDELSAIQNKIIRRERELRLLDEQRKL